MILIIKYMCSAMLSEDVEVLALTNYVTTVLLTASC